MFHKIRKKIKLKIILLLVIAITIFTTMFSSYHYMNKINNMNGMLQDNLNRTISRLNQNLIVPLWEIDSEWVNDILETEMLDKHLYAVIVKGEGALLVSKKRDKDWNIIDSTEGIEGAYLEISSDIIHDGVSIGEVKIYITDKFNQEEILRETFSHALASIFLGVFLILVLYIILDFIILKPLQTLLATIEDINSGQSKQVAILNGEDEIGTLTKEFNSMIINLKDKENMLIAQSRHAAMGEMISMIAHQWRQPITVVSMIANNMVLDVELDESTPDKIKKSAMKTLKQTEFLSKTIDDFKNFFKPNKKKELTLVNNILDENFSIIGKSLENHNIDVIKLYNSNTAILIHSRELLQVFINILKNAKEALLEHKTDNPTITVKTNENDENVIISICDNGKGIDEDVISKIYDPYFSTKDEKVGTGLGLYMSKTIIEKHLHGRIKAKNQEDGGVCFDIFLPKESK